MSAAHDEGNVVPSTASQEDWVHAHARDELFEDILDIEGGVRVAMASVAGFASPGDVEFERGLTLLEGRISKDASLQLRGRAHALRKAVDAKDAAGVRAAQESIIELLAELRCQAE